MFAGQHRAVHAVAFMEEAVVVLGFGNGRLGRSKPATFALALFAAGCALALGNLPANAATTASAQAATTAPSKAVRHPRPHVMVLMMENESYSDVIGSYQAPYQTRLAQHYENVIESYGVGHYSLDNYLGSISGKFYKSSAKDCAPGPTCSFTGPTLASQLDAARVPWTAYLGGMTRNCSGSDEGGSGGYAVRHDPFVYFPAVVRADCGKIRPAASTGATTALPTLMNTTLNSRRAPTFVWYSPTIDQDGGYDSALSTIRNGDKFLSREISRIQASRWYRAGGTIVLTYDEGDYFAQPAAGEHLSGDGNHVPTIIISKATHRSPSYNLYVNRFGLLASLEHAYGLPCLAQACKQSGGLTGNGSGMMPLTRASGAATKPVMLQWPI